MELIGRNLAGKIRATFTDAEGAAAAPSGTPTVTVTRDSDGTDVVTAADATVAGNVATYTLDPLSAVELLNCEWSGTVSGKSVKVRTQVGVVGGFLCTLEEIAEIVTASGGTPPPNEGLRAAREAAEQFLEARSGVAFRPTYAKATGDGPGSNHLLLPNPRVLRVLSAKIDGTAVDLNEITILDTGVLEREAGWAGDIEIVYEHGWAVPPPDVSRACVKLARHYLQPVLKDLDERASRIEAGDVSYGFLTTAGERGAETSIPEVNEVISRHRYMPVA